MKKRTVGIAAAATAAAVGGTVLLIRRRKKRRAAAQAAENIPDQAVPASDYTGKKGANSVKKKARSVFRFLFMAAFAVSLVMMGLHFWDYYNGEADYQDAADVAGFVEEPAENLSGENAGADPGETSSPAGSTSGESVPPASSGEVTPPASSEPIGSTAAGGTAGSRYDEKLKNIDLKALRQINPEVIGWINIPRTGLSYPLMQTDNNDYYLTHTWKNKRNKVGAIFMEYQNKADFSDFHTLIYGHNMSDGSMFGMLKQYKTVTNWKYNPLVYIVTDRGIQTWKIFSIYEAPVKSLTYRLDFSEGGDTAKQEFIDYCVAQTTIETGVVPTVNDKIITLSTCTGQNHVKRFVVQAVLVE